jgi:hypothetical protein
MTGQAATVLRFEDWYFCQRLNCRDGEVFPLVRERYSARQWLQRLKTDAFRMLAMRSLLSQARGWDLGRLSDDAVIDQIADLVVTSRLHIHMPRVAVIADGGGQSQQSTASTENKTETSPAFPLSDRSRRGASAAASRQPIVDPPTFSSEMDSAAQAATLVAAAATGAAACHL